MASNLIKTNKTENTYNHAFFALDEAREIFINRDVFLSSTIDKALNKSFKLYEDICEERKAGRYVLSMPTGTGKTTSIIAWCKTIYDEELDYSVCIASSKVEELFKVRKELILAGVNADQIGVLYNDTGSDFKKFKEISPSVKSPENYRFLLVSHQRLTMDKQEYDYKNYSGSPRSITFWDEEFIKTESTCFGIEKIQGEIGRFLSTCDVYRPDNLDAKDIDLLKSFLHKVNDKFNEYHTSDKVNVLTIDEEFIANNTIELNGIIDACSYKKKLDKEVCKFLKGIIAQDALFFFESSVMSYRDVIDDDIKNIVVLDASYPISPFYKLDKELHHVSFDPIRSYKNLKITHRKLNSGRYKIEDIFTAPDSKIDLFDSLEEKCRSVPPEEALLLFIFKTKDGKDYESEIVRELKNRGIDLDAQISWKKEQKPKYNFLTWGKEKATNDYIHCQHFINIGLLDIGSDNLIAQAKAQSGISYVSTPPIYNHTELRDRDYAQRLYQAISRTAIRLPKSGLNCTATILTYSDGCLEYLEEVFSGAELVKGKPILDEEVSNTDKWCNGMLEFLDQIPDFTNETTITKINKAVFKNLKGVVKGTTDIKRQASKKLRGKLRKDDFGWKESKDGKGTLIRFSPFDDE